MKEYVHQEEIIEENTKREFTILRIQCTYSLLTKLGEDMNYKFIERDQYVIKILKLVKGVMFKFDWNKELTHRIW